MYISSKPGSVVWGFLFLVAASTAASAGAAASSRERGRDERVAERQVGNPHATVEGEINGATGEANYVVQFADAPLASYRGGIKGLAPTSPVALGTVKLNGKSSASRAYLAYLDGEQARMIGLVQAAVGRSPRVLFRYRVAYNGVALTLTPAEAARIAQLPGVHHVQREAIQQVTTDVGPAWIGAPGIWDGSTTQGPGTLGEGVVVGILDTGLNMRNHPSFADIGDDGYDHTNPLGAGNYLGLCATDPGTWVCNDKLIGYYIYTGETTDDTSGHGSHTASTVAGNFVFNAEVNAPTTTYTANISGVAPHANLIGYDVCVDGGGCTDSALMAAIDQATADGVDVINYSISGGDFDVWNVAVAQAFLAAVEAGVIPVASAGNSGPTAGTSNHVAPWMLTVGASSHNRKIRNDLVDMTSPGAGSLADMIGAGLTAGYGPAPIVFAGDYGNALCAPSTWAPDTFSGEIVVCDRGGYGRVEKSAAVLAAGGGGYVLANTAFESATVNGDPFALPGVHITDENGIALKAWLTGGSDHQATIGGFVVSLDPSAGDAMAYFSSRGPSPAIPTILKPDVTAPGLDIMAASAANQGFTIMSGTSMSSPHMAGAAALMRALYPTWSVAEIKSALMSTALTGVVKEDRSTPADPFDMGTGRVNLTGAAQAGLVLDIPVADYAAADPGTGGDPRTLNLASLADDQCLNSCSWTRVVSGTLGTGTDWTVSTASADGVVIDVSPSSFSLPAGGSQELTITATVSGLPTDDWLFGVVMIDEDTAAAAGAHLSLAVVPRACADVLIAPTPIGPVDGAVNQSVRPVLEWTAVAGADGYLVEVASDAGFTAIVDSAAVSVASYQVSVDLNFETTYYWRVAATDLCATGPFSSASGFTVAGDGTTCPAGMSIVYDYLEDFDSGAAGWTHTTADGPDTWALQDTNPSPGSGGFNYHADDYPAYSYQLLVSPVIALPSGTTLLTMQFLNYQSFEDPSGSNGCWDGGTLEVSNDGGSSWVQLDRELLSDPYDGFGDNGPPGGVHVWCGETGGVQPWLNSTVDMSAFGGQSVQFRFRLLSDVGAGAPGWNIDDVSITHCECAPIPTAPGGSPQLSLLKTGNDTELSWSSVPAAAWYDVIVGDLTALRSGEGDFSLATNECLGTDLTTTALTHSVDPPAGGGFWFLVRAASCAGAGQYDSGFPGQSGSRDAEVTASGNDCGAPPSSGPQWASTAFASSEYTDTGWSALQATGPPDTLSCGDNPTAWAPLDPGTNLEWLEVGFDTPVMATGVNVWETNVGGFIYQVDARLQGGSLQTVWTGTDDTPCFGVFHATWPAPAERVTGLRIHTQVDGWEEIDAVELLVVSPPPTTVSAFTGGDPGEGLDFAGTFVHAVNVRGPGGFSIGDAAFTDDSAPGVSWTADTDILNWTAPEYGATADDDNLEVVMQSIRWSTVPQTVTFTLGGLTPGARYKLQLLFYEGCCERGFDVFVDGRLVVDEFAPYQVDGGINPPGSGAVVTHTFDARSTSVEIVLDGSNATFLDRNPMLDGLTLEFVGGGP